MTAPDRRTSSPDHRHRVHVAALLLVRLHHGDYADALARAESWGQDDSIPGAFYRDVAALLARREAVLLVA